MKVRELPRRIRGLVDRHLRLPAHQQVRHHELATRLEQLDALLTIAVREIADLRRQVEHNAATASEQVAAVQRAALRPEDLTPITAEVAELRVLAEAVAAADEDTFRHLGTSTTALLDQLGRTSAAAPPDAPLVSIVLPVRDRARELRRAVRSVLAQTATNWQLVIVDDRSTVPAAVTLSDLVADDRIVIIESPAPGAAAARNHGLASCDGDLITFIDSDNWWYPHRLASVLADLDPATPWAIDQQLVRHGPEAPSFVREGAPALADIDQHNSIDLGMIVARREAMDQLAAGRHGGPFDPSFARLSDWDLVCRLVELGPPQCIPSLGQVYETRVDGRISDTEPFGPPAHTIRARARAGAGAGLRILCAEWHYPQVTESYIEADIEGLRAIGAEVEVWSDDDVAVPYEPHVPWRRGRLDDAVADFRPDLVFTHWLTIGRDLRDAVRALGIPHAVRAHGFDHDEAIIGQLVTDRDVALHLFPHQVGPFAAYPNVSVHRTAFDPGRIQPAREQDRRLVLRLAAGLTTKELELFALVAMRCPEHRFVLGVGRGYLVEHQADAIAAQFRDLGAPVDVRLDVAYDDAAELTMRAGIYLHTHGRDHRLGMPISPIEAMAAGSFVLARNLPGSEYLGTGAVRYDGATIEERADLAAALVNDTLTWDDLRWAEQRRRALDHAWSHHPADLVMADIVAVWRDRFDL